MNRSTRLGACAALLLSATACLGASHQPEDAPPALEARQTRDAGIAKVDARVTAQPIPAVETVGETKALAVVAGGLRQPAAGQRNVNFYGTDLGWTFTHDGQLWVMFGDTWKSWTGATLQRDADDALGHISLAKFPDGDSVEAWVAAHPPAKGNPFWMSAAPPIQLVLDGLSRVLPIRQLLNGSPLTSAAGLTPITGFSNARSDDASAAFGVFLRNEPVQCSTTGKCGEGFDCDAKLGRCAPVNDLSAACVIGTTSCRCVAIGSKTGLCQDRGSSLYDPYTERGRANAVVMRQQVGNALRGSITNFATQPWDTHRFFNATARTINDFDPARPDGAGNDYLAADGHDFAGEGVFLWGRPNFGGVGVQGRDAQLYLAWVPMPSYNKTGNFPWRPQFFAGLDPEGRPLFSPQEHEALALDLDADSPDYEPEEVRDLVGQMTISWIPSLARWVMLYGGDMGTQFINDIFGPDAKLLQRDPLGAIYIRYAEHPWGPWTPPKPVLIAGDPDRGITGQYGPGGILYDDGCTQASCAPGEFVFSGLPNERGRLYGPNIIDPWVEVRDDGAAVDLYWHVSTWNPYQVVLMKTRLATAP